MLIHVSYVKSRKLAMIQMILIYMSESLKKF